MSTVYSIDTSALVTWYVRRYPPSVFPSLLERVEGLIGDNRLMASEYVLKELGGKRDPLFEWAARQDGFAIRTTAEVASRAAELVAKYPLLVDPSSLRPIQADPFVIALAESLDRGVVVTQETYAKTKTKGKRRNRTYVPDVCRAEGIECIDFLDMLRREKWTL